MSHARLFDVLVVDLVGVGHHSGTWKTKRQLKRITAQGHSLFTPIQTQARFIVAFL